MRSFFILFKSFFFFFFWRSSIVCFWGRVCCFIVLLLLFEKGKKTTFVMFAELYGFAPVSAAVALSVGVSTVFARSATPAYSSPVLRVINYLSFVGGALPWSMDGVCIGFILWTARTIERRRGSAKYLLSGLVPAIAASVVAILLQWRLPLVGMLWPAALTCIVLRIATEAEAKPWVPTVRRVLAAAALIQIIVSALWRPQQLGASSSSLLMTGVLVGLGVATWVLLNRPAMTGIISRLEISAAMMTLRRVMAPLVGLPYAARHRVIVVPSEVGVPQAPVGTETEAEPRTESGAFEASEESVEFILGMGLGCTRADATEALRAAHGNVDTAVSLILDGFTSGKH